MKYHKTRFKTTWLLKAPAKAMVSTDPHIFSYFTNINDRKIHIYYTLLQSKKICILYLNPPSSNKAKKVHIVNYILLSQSNTAL